METDIRWEQRFNNFLKAFHKLKQSVTYIRQTGISPENAEPASGNVLNEMIIEGLIQRFEYTHELAWNVMKDYAGYQGNTQIGGARDATREGFQLQLFSNGEVWMDMIKSRNQTSHTYNEATAKEISTKILKDYFPALEAFKKTMETKITGKASNLFEEE